MFICAYLIKFLQNAIYLKYTLSYFMSTWKTIAVPFKASAMRVVINLLVAYSSIMIHPALATFDAIILNIYMYSYQKTFTLEFSKSILMRPQGNNQSVKMCVNITLHSLCDLRWYTSF